MMLTCSFCVADCLQRALGLLNGCQPFLNALNANGGQLSKLTIFQILQLAIQDKQADLTYVTSCCAALSALRVPNLHYCHLAKPSKVCQLHWQQNQNSSLAPGRHLLVWMLLSTAICVRRCYNAVASFLNGVRPPY